jgi:phage FluMu protein Com
VKILDGHKGKRCDEAEYLTYTHKRCPKCTVVKSVSLFYRKNTTTARAWAWDSHCIECRRSYCADYGTANRDQRNARLKAWRISNPKAASKNDKRKHLKQKYGLSINDVEAMRATQDGKCEICERSTQRLFVDHCHTKGHVRSLLCQTCNTFLGWYEKKADTILRFQKYIDGHAK